MIYFHRFSNFSMKHKNLGQLFHGKLRTNLMDLVKEIEFMPEFTNLPNENLSSHK